MRKSSDISRAPFGVTVIATAFLLNAIIVGYLNQRDAQAALLPKPEEVEPG
jgi:hypothetical protein